MNKKNQASKFKWNYIIVSLPYTTHSMDSATRRNKQETPGLFVTSGGVGCPKLQLEIITIFDQVFFSPKSIFFWNRCSWLLVGVVSGRNAHRATLHEKCPSVGRKFIKIIQINSCYFGHLTPLGVANTFQSPKSTRGVGPVSHLFNTSNAMMNCGTWRGRAVVPAR